MRLSQITALLFFLYTAAGALPIHGNTEVYHLRSLLARDHPPPSSKSSEQERLRAQQARIVAGLEQGQGQGHQEHQGQQGQGPPRQGLGGIMVAMTEAHRRVGGGGGGGDGTAHNPR